jgi:hypothetical protein
VVSEPGAAAGREDPPRQPARSQPAPCAPASAVGAARCRHDSAQRRARLRARQRGRVREVVQKLAAATAPRKSPPMRAQMSIVPANFSGLAQLTEVTVPYRLNLVKRTSRIWSAKAGFGAFCCGRTAGYSQGTGCSGTRAIPSCNAACCQGFGAGSGGTGRGAVSRMNRSSAATTAAASSGEASGATIVSLGRRFTTVTPRLRVAGSPRLRPS